jgi:hypothetical protein
MKVSQDSMVVRNLIVVGYDVQARNLLRSIDEHVDAIYYLCLRPEACDKFVLTIDDKSSNAFWYEHIRGARKFIDGELRRKSGGDVFQEFSRYKKSEREMFSSAHHPSYVASTVPFLAPYGSVRAFDYLFGTPNEFSYRTGAFLFFLLVEMAMMLGYLDADLTQIIKSRSRDPVREFIRKGHPHLVRMLLFLSKNNDAPIFSESKLMGDFIKTLPE